jgi:precorrin-2 dehydrogenase/sirohydrochlorin ferrochelatase
MPLYPVNLKINGRLCLVIGGGEVAFRKIKSLLRCDACIRVVSPELVPELITLVKKEKVEWLDRGYVEGDLKGVFLAYAATNDHGVQKMIREEADKYSVMLNCADDPKGSDFHVPAHFHRGRMLLTISTGGGSPALAKMIRQQLEKEIVPGYEAVVDLMAMIRNEVVGGVGDSSENKELFYRLLEHGIVELVLSGNWFDLQMFLLEELPGEIDSVNLIKEFLEIHDKT